MPFGKGDTFYLFHQRDTRKPCPFGEPFGWDLATTKDFVTYEDCGTAILRGDDIKQDQFIFAGSVCEDRDGVYIAFIPVLIVTISAETVTGADARNQS